MKKALVKDQAEEIQYKHKPTGVFLYKIETPDRIYFIFENRAIDNPVLQIKF